MLRGPAAPTPSRAASLVLPPGLGVATRVQLVPFQCTDTVAWVLLVVSVNPTAQTLAGLIAAAQTTPLLPALVMPGEGTAITVQRVPFQCHARFLLWRLPPLM